MVNKFSIAQILLKNDCQENHVQTGVHIIQEGGEKTTGLKAGAKNQYMCN